MEKLEELETKEVILPFGKCRVRGYTSLDAKKSLIKASRINREFDEKIKDLKGNITGKAKDFINEQRDNKLAMMYFEKLSGLIAENDFDLKNNTMPIFLSKCMDSEVAKIEKAIDSLSSLNEEEKSDFLQESSEGISEEPKTENL